MVDRVMYERRVSIGRHCTRLVGIPSFIRGAVKRSNRLVRFG